MARAPLTVLSTLALLAGLVAAPAQARAEEAECGETELSQEAKDALAQAQASEEDDKADDGTVRHVPVYLHVIRRAPQGEGDMPVAHARAITVDTINRELAAQRIPFVLDLKKIDYTTVDADTYHLEQNSDIERGLYDDLAVTGRRNLNIFIVGPRAGTSVTGWAEFLVNPALRRGDHIALRYFPARQGFSDPLTPVHEFGHWMGLLHTFQFGCGELAHGDLIRDTATQTSGVFTCAPTTDTCPDDEGLDPVDNIMGYSAGCRGVFSPGQQKRMTFLWRTARGGKSDDEVTDEPLVIEDDAADGGCSTTGRGSVGGALVLALAALAGARRHRRA